MIFSTSSFSYGDPGSVNDVSAVESAGGRVPFVGLTCDERELERRIEAPSRKAFGKLNSAQTYRALRAEGAFDVASLPADLEIDTGTCSAAEAAERVAAALAKIIFRDSAVRQFKRVMLGGRLIKSRLMFIVVD